MSPAQTLFKQADPGVSIANDLSDYTMGMQFQLSQPAPLTGIWFYSAPTATELPAGAGIYRVSDHALLVSNPAATWSGPPGSGWVKCAFGGTDVLAAGVAYKVCVLKDFGGALVYSATGFYWDTGPGSAGISSGIISAPSNAVADNGQDTFANPSTGFHYPGSSFHASNYWIDVEVMAPSPFIAAQLAGASGEVIPARKWLTPSGPTSGQLWPRSWPSAHGTVLTAGQLWPRGRP